MLVMKPWKWVVLAFVTYLILLVAYLPAAHVVSYVQKQNPKLPVSIGTVEGTLWSGRVDRIMTNGVLLNNFRWELSAWALLIGQAKVEVNGGKIRESDQAYIDGQVSASLFNSQKLSAKNLKVLLPAKAVIAQVPLPVPVTADGRFRIDVESFDFNKSCKLLSGTGRWLKGTVSGPTGVIDFGNYEANLSCEDDKFVVQVLPDNKLNLDAMVVVGMDGKYDLSGKFKPDASMPREVHMAAQSFGRADAEGFRQLR